MQLTTDRLHLREFVADDWPAVLAYQRKSSYLRFYPWINRTKVDAQAFVQMFLEQQKATPRTKFQLVIELKSTGQLIGNCGLRLKSAESHEAEIGFELDPGHWGKGYATEAARIMLQHGFSQFQLHRISSHCIAENGGSARVLEKLGMRQEGRLRDAECFKGRYWDVLLYAILRQKWQEIDSRRK